MVVELRNLFEVYMREGDLRPRTVDNYHSPWRRFVEPSIGRVPVIGLKPLDLVEWRTSLMVARSRVESAAAQFRAILNLAIKQGRIVANPAATRRRRTKDRRSHRRDPARTFRLTREQVENVADEMPARHRLAVLFAAGTG